MCVNLDKSHIILLDKHKSDYTGTKRSAGSEDVQDISSVDLLSAKIALIYISIEFANLLQINLMHS